MRAVFEINFESSVNNLWITVAIFIAVLAEKDDEEIADRGEVFHISKYRISCGDVIRLVVILLFLHNNLDPGRTCRLGCIIFNHNSYPGFNVIAEDKISLKRRALWQYPLWHERSLMLSFCQCIPDKPMNRSRPGCERPQ